MNISYELPTFEVEFEKVTIPTGGDATAADLIEGKTALSGGKLITGTIPTATELEYELITSPLTVPTKGKYFDSDVTVSANLKSGYEFFYDFANDLIDTINLEAISKNYYKDTGKRILTFRPFLFSSSSLRDISSFPNYTPPEWRGYEFGENCFEACELETLNVNKGGTLNKWGEYCFSECHNLTSVTSIYNGFFVNTCPNIPSYCFNGCDALESVEIGHYGENGLIGSYVFNNCSSLTSITLRNYKTIAANAFYRCLFLERVEFLGEVNSIGNYLLGTGNATTSNIDTPITVIFNNTTPPAITTTTFGSLTSASNRLQLEIYVPDAAYDTYCNATNWSAVHRKWGLRKISELPAGYSLEEE